MSTRSSRVDLVRGAQVDVVELAKDLVPLVDVALVQLVVRLDGLPGDAVELEQLGLQLAWDDRFEGVDVWAMELLRRGVCARRSITVSLRTTCDQEELWPTRFPPLPYDYNALEPHIDERDDAHPPRQAPPGLRRQRERRARRAPNGPTSRSRGPQNLDSVPEDKRTAVRNNAGGHANHSLFWQIMSPDGGGEPDGALEDAIDDDVRRRRRAEAAGQRRRREALRLRLDVARPGGDGALGRSRRRTRTRRSWRARRRSSGSTSGSTPTTSTYQNRRPDYLDGVVERRQLGRPSRSDTGPETTRERRGAPVAALPIRAYARMKFE